MAEIAEATTKCLQLLKKKREKLNEEDESNKEREDCIFISPGG